MTVGDWQLKALEYAAVGGYDDNGLGRLALN